MSAAPLVRYPESVVVLALDDAWVALITQRRPGASGNRFPRW